MELRECCDNVHKDVRTKSAKQFVIFVFLACVFVYGRVVAADFVPFVIPAKPNTGSLIAVTSFEPIRIDSDRLQTVNSHFYRSDKRVRLWGVNLSFGANLPKHADAPYIAARLAAAGVNTVRCHHMDSARWPRGLWDAKNGKNITPEALDKLDYFIDQLARHGICVNINLHVGRAHSEYLGLPKANRQYDKIFNIFTPALIDAQKKYARELLGHVNPYRKVHYADDPAVAIVEITNENSFFMWASEQTLRTLPPYYKDILQNKFNAWLKKRHGSDEKLRDAWAEGVQSLGKNVLTNGNFQATVSDRSAPKDWHLEQHSECKASMSRRRYKSKDALRIEIGKSNQTEWHLQLSQRDLSVKAGRYYTIIFEAAADEPRKISCNVSQAHSPWNNLGLARQVELAGQWQKFRYGFVAKADDDNARMSFAFGGSNIPVYLANVEFCSGGRVGLEKGESIRAGSVALFADNESPQRILDRMCFLAETEKSYFDEMRNFVKNELDCKALVTGTIVFGPLGLYAQSDMDFIDAHAYWQHPRFPGRPWDSGNWVIDQKPMVDYLEQATLFRLAAQRLEGKPFTVSEYNHPAPLDSQAECVPMIASFAAAQDWDGVWLYTYSHSSDDWDRENLNSYFDIDTNPAKWGFMRAGSAIFREVVTSLKGRLVAVLSRSSDVVQQLAQLHLKYGGNMFDAASAACGATRQEVLSNPLYVSLRHSSGVAEPDQSSTELTWSVEDGNGFYMVAGDAGVLSGHTDRFEQETDGYACISSPAYAVITATPLDGLAWPQSSKILITACGRCENIGMIFSEDRRTVGRDWGGPPVQIEAVEGTVVLPEGQWKCEALGPDGTPKFEVPIAYREDRGVLKLSPQYKTMWYFLMQSSKQE